jgi:hypothetical protein
MNARMIPIIAGLTASGVVLAQNYDDWKAPAPLKPGRPSCVFVEGFDRRCIAVEPQVLKAWHIRPGATVTPKTMILIDDDNRAVLAKKLR